MSLTQLHYFLGVATAGSLTKAATNLGVAQPTISEQIRRLERELDIALFDRARNRLTLTDAGRRLIPHARRVVEECGAAVASVTNLRELESGTVTFGMFNSAQFVLSGLIPAFRAKYPNVSVRITGSNSAQIADEVRAGRLEAGLVALPVDAHGLNIGETLWSCEAAYFHLDPAATAGPATIESILARPLVLPDASWADSDPTRRQLNERAQRLGIPLTPDIEVETGAGALSVAASGIAGAIASVPVAEALGYTERLGRASLDPPLIETFALVTRTLATVSPATQAMLRFVGGHMRMLHDEHLAARVLPHSGD